MEPLVALVADYQLLIIIITILHTDLTRHILQPLIPLLSRNIRRLQPQIPLTPLRPTQTLRQRRTIHIKLIIKRQLLILLDIF